MKKKDPIKVNKSTYNTTAIDYSRVYGNYGITKDKPVLETFAKLLKPSMKILDLGSGDGTIANYFSVQGFDVLGIDISENLIDIAKAKFPSGAFEVQNIIDINYKSEFDAVIASYSLSHFPKNHLPFILEKIYKALNANGLFLLLLLEGNEEKYIDDDLSDGKLFVSFYQKDEIEEIIKTRKLSILKSQRISSSEDEEFNYHALCIIAKKT